MSRVAPLVLSLLVFGCPNTNMPLPLPPDAGTADFVGRACNVDAECGVLRCDKVRRQCICLSDDSCRMGTMLGATPKYCNNFTGQCVEEIAGCRFDTECAMGEYCDPSIRACRSLKSFCETCSANNECGGNDDNCVLDTTLNQKFCGKACADNSNCPRGSTCQQKDGVGQCWPDKTPQGQTATCRNFQGCIPDSQRSCNTTPDCMDSTQRCDPRLGKCVAAAQVCPFGTTCDPRARLCVAECSRDADCGDSKLRCISRVCEPLNECNVDTDCAENRVCTKPPGEPTGRCQPFCTTDSQCPVGQVCARTASNRFGCAPGCSVNADCGLDQRCNGRTKICEGPVIGTARACQGTSACNTCEVCEGSTNLCRNAKSDFPFCQTCATSAECPG
ncbi:MAG: hypothetical protein JNJ54_36770, partial [Myxococcaceae bacterium]|nr:hypothetical protein [Myxococcaceae bacterium]